MTIVELSIGMVITTLVMGAVSALWFGVCRTWQRGDGAQNVALTSGQATARLEATFRAAKYVFQIANGSVDGVTTPAAAAFFWKGDNWPATANADQAVQIAELALVEHDPAAKRLYLYQAIPYASMTVSQKSRAAGVATYADLALASTRTTFKGYDFVQRQVISESITGALFGTPATSARPMLEFTLNLKRADGTALVYGAATLRGPTTRPL
jgi:hypothetical protein